METWILMMQTDLYLHGDLRGLYILYSKDIFSDYSYVLSEVLAMETGNGIIIKPD
jgi:hypothetical protein